LQRLFSTFPEGWPGLGLLLMRIVAGATVLHDGILRLFAIHASLEVAVANSLAVLASLSLMLGLWTPVAGVIVALAEAWIGFSERPDLWIQILLVALGLSLAMLGPGAWSIDSHLFGRRRLTNHNR
jgi:hypothetical protein